MWWLGLDPWTRFQMNVLKGLRMLAQGCNQMSSANLVATLGQS